MHRRLHALPIISFLPHNFCPSVSCPFTPPLGTSKVGQRVEATLTLLLLLHRLGFTCLFNLLCSRRFIRILVDLCPALLDNFSRPTSFHPYQHWTSIESSYRPSPGVEVRVAHRQQAPDICIKFQWFSLRHLPSSTSSSTCFSSAGNQVYFFCSSPKYVNLVDVVSQL